MTLWRHLDAFKIRTRRRPTKPKWQEATVNEASRHASKDWQAAGLWRVRAPRPITPFLFPIAVWKITSRVTWMRESRLGLQGEFAISRGVSEEQVARRLPDRHGKSKRRFVEKSIVSNATTWDGAPATYVLT